MIEFSFTMINYIYFHITFLIVILVVYGSNRHKAGLIKNNNEVIYALEQHIESLEKEVLFLRNLNNPTAAEFVEENH